MIPELIKHILNKGKTCTKEVVQKRLEICEECPEYLKEKRKCQKCGCFMGIKAKWETSECPLNKW